MIEANAMRLRGSSVTRTIAKVLSADQISGVRKEERSRQVREQGSTSVYVAVGKHFLMGRVLRRSASF